MTYSPEWVAAKYNWLYLSSFLPPVLALLLMLQLGISWRRPWSRRGVKCLIILVLMAAGIVLYIRSVIYQWELRAAIAASSEERNYIGATYKRDILYSPITALTMQTTMMAAAGIMASIVSRTLRPDLYCTVPVVAQATADPPVTPEVTLPEPAAPNPSTK